jgi:hypothetical protein
MDLMKANPNFKTDILAFSNIFYMASREQPAAEVYISWGDTKLQVQK